jgi:hypothetical protein
MGPLSPHRRMRIASRPTAARVLRFPGLVILVGSLLLVAGGCSNSTGPSGPVLTGYHYVVAGSLRYYEETRQIDTVIGTTDTVITRVEIVVDSLWRIYVDSTGVLWSQSIVKSTSLPPLARERHSDPASPQATTRRVGLLADTIFVDENLRDHVLEGPLDTGRTWLVRSDGTISAYLVGRESLELGIGPTEAWHVNMGAVADEWWALGLGRVQYDEFDSDGIRVHGVLIAVDTIPTTR